MHLRRCQTFGRGEARPWETVVPRELSGEEREAIFGVVALAAPGGADRGDVLAALRGSRSARVRAAGLVDGAGHGVLAAMSEDEVLARIDTLIAEGVLEVECGADGRVRLRVGG